MRGCGGGQEARTRTCTSVQTRRAKYNIKHKTLPLLHTHLLDSSRQSTQATPCFPCSSDSIRPSKIHVNKGARHVNSPLPRRPFVAFRPESATVAPSPWPAASQTEEADERISRKTLRFSNRRLDNHFRRAAYTGLGTEFHLLHSARFIGALAKRYRSYLSCTLPFVRRRLRAKKSARAAAVHTRTRPCNRNCSCNCSKRRNRVDSTARRGAPAAPQFTGTDRPQSQTACPFYAWPSKPGSPSFTTAQA